MNRHSMFVKIVRLCLTLLVALTTTLTPLPRDAHAGRGHGPAAATEVTWEEGGDPGADRWWGAAGAVLCGAGIGLARWQPAIGMNPYVLAATVGGCLLAALDIWTT